MRRILDALAPPKFEVKPVPDAESRGIMKPIVGCYWTRSEACV
jgi:hypothetical protein